MSTYIANKNTYLLLERVKVHPSNFALYPIHRHCARLMVSIKRSDTTSSAVAL